MFWRPSCFSLLAILAMAVAGRAQTYVLVTPDATINSAGWALSSSYMSPFVTAITDPANFGRGGLVETSIQLNQLSVVDASTLAGANGFVEAWWENTQSSPSQAAILSAFQAGMDLWLLEDDSSHNGLGTALGITQTPATGVVSNGSGSFLSGPFGTATNIAVSGNYARFDDANITALGGTVFMRNENGEATGVYWAKGAFAPGAGQIVLVSDIDMLSTFTATYSPLNSNGIFALNLAATMVTAVPEPGTWVLMLSGLVPLVGALRRKRR